ncbi:hypothetical protein [Aquipseudomonas campi]
MLPSRIPFGLSQEQFRQRYQRCLGRASAHLIQQLRELITRPVPSTINAAQVQIFLEEEGQRRPSIWVYFQGENNKVDPADQSIFPGRSLEISTGLVRMDAFDEHYFSDPEFAGTDLIANILKAWFAECWWKAGGWSYAVPATVWVHDGLGDGQSIELSEPR